MIKWLQEEEEIIALFFNSNGLLEVGSRKPRDSLPYNKVKLRCNVAMDHLLPVISEWFPRAFKAPCISSSFHVMALKALIDGVACLAIVTNVLNPKSPSHYTCSRLKPFYPLLP
jgi:hypothetical protein